MKKSFWLAFYLRSISPLGVDGSQGCFAGEGAMAGTAAQHVSIFVRLWRVLPFVAAPLASTASAEGPSNLGVEELSTPRLRDLGFDADQLGSSISFAKGQHYRHF